MTTEPPLHVVDVADLEIDMWGNTLIDIKDDYDEEEPDLIEGPMQQPKPDVFHVGDEVRVVAWAYGHVWFTWDPDDSPRYFRGDYPHAGMVGEVIDRPEERLYTVRFKDGTQASYYHNEIQGTLP